MTRSDRGFVLVNALIIVAAISAISVGMMHDTSRSIERLDAAQATSQSDLYLDAAAALSARLLSEDAATSEIDHLAEPWSLERLRATIDRGETVISVSDLQGRFNLNLLLRPDPRAEVAAFLALAEAARIDSAAAEAIIAHYGGFVIASTAPPGGGRGMLFANAELALRAELVAIPGVAEEDVVALWPFVALLPTGALVNANTARPEVLGALLGIADASRMGTFDDLRRKQPFANLEEFRAAASQVFGPEAADRVAPQLVSFHSDWFEATTEVELDAVRRTARYLLYRDPETGATSVAVRAAGNI